MEQPLSMRKQMECERTPHFYNLCILDSTTLAKFLLLWQPQPENMPTIPILSLVYFYFRICICGGCKYFKLIMHLTLLLVLSSFSWILENDVHILCTVSFTIYCSKSTDIHVYILYNLYYLTLATQHIILKVSSFQQPIFIIS